LFNQIKNKFILLFVGGIDVEFDGGVCVDVVVVVGAVEVVSVGFFADSCLVIVKPIPGFGMDGMDGIVIAGNLLPATKLANSSGFRARSGSNSFLASSSMICACSSLLIETNMLFSGSGAAGWFTWVEGLFAWVLGFFLENLLPANKPPAMTSGFKASIGNNVFSSFSLDSKLRSSSLSTTTTVSEGLSLLLIVGNKYFISSFSAVSFPEK
jgi:hypothetical protein